MIVSAPEGGGIPDATLTSVDAHLATIIDAVRPLLPAEYDGPGL